MRATSILARWLAFNGVGALGVAVQLGVLAVLVHLASVHYLVATVLAVEAAILHNFAWHQRWTWKDRPSTSARDTILRFARFNLLNGAVSLVGNVAIVAALTGGMGADPVLANIAAIISCSVINFMLSETLVFRTAALGALALLAGAPEAWAGPSPTAARTWKTYEARVEGRFSPPSGPFFIMDAEIGGRGWRDAVRRGEVKMIGVPAPSAGGAQVHHWVGSVFVPGAQLDDVLQRLLDNAGKESAFYDDVVASKLLSKKGDRASIFMKLRRESVITVMYNTEHDIEYRRLGAGRAMMRSVATRIAELADAGTPKEREKRPGDDHGFLWHLNAYWRYEQVDGGVLIECESVSLSRNIPWILRPVAAPIVDRIARESLDRTLRAVRTFLDKR